MIYAVMVAVALVVLFGCLVGKYIGAGKLRPSLHEGADIRSQNRDRYLGVTRQLDQAEREFWGER